MSLAPEIRVAINSQPLIFQSKRHEYSLWPRMISSGTCNLSFIIRHSVKHACHMSSKLYTIFEQILVVNLQMKIQMQPNFLQFEIPDFFGFGCAVGSKTKFLIKMNRRGIGTQHP